MTAENPSQGEVENPLNKINKENEIGKSSIESGVREALQGLKVEAAAGIGTNIGGSSVVDSPSPSSPLPFDANNVAPAVQSVNPATNIGTGGTTPSGVVNSFGGSNETIDSTIGTNNPGGTSVVESPSPSSPLPFDANNVAPAVQSVNPATNIGTGGTTPSGVIGTFGN